MKKGWTYKKFKEVCTSITDGDWIEKKDQSQSGIRLVQTGNIGIGEFIPKDDSHKYITEDTFKRLRCTEIFEGDILISRLPNPLGRSCILPKLETRCITAVDCSILRIKKDAVLPQFFVYYTQSQGYFSKIDAESSGTTRARITRKKLEETTIPIPSVSEQKKIVERLDAAFAQIDELKANAEKQLAEARALFQKALAKAMEPKEGWEEKKFKELCSFVRGPFGGSLTKSCFVPSGYAVYEQQNAIYNRFTFRYFIDEEKYKSMQRFAVNPGDLIMSCSGTIGKVAIVPDGAAEGIINQALLKLTPKKVLDKYYLKYLMESSIFNDLIAQYSDGAAIKNIASVAILKEIKLNIPPLSEQQRIVERLDSISENVRKYEDIQLKIIAECDALKQALLRQVFE